MSDMSLENALELVLKQIKPNKATEDITLDSALGRILAADIKASINVPPQDTAAVDGYAFYADDLEDGKAVLPIRGNIKAGHPYEKKAERGYAYRIFTGAPIPKGPDTVAMQEFCTLEDKDQIRLPKDLGRGSNFRPCGENVSKGETILKQGFRLGASEIGLAAAVGITSLAVAKPLKVKIISMGDEVAEAGSSKASKAGYIHDSNRPMLMQLAGAEGHAIVDGGIIGDSLDALTKAYSEDIDKVDAVISSGGSADGEEDYARPAIMASGGEVIFSRLAIKPGRPMSVGLVKNKPIFCLPGNPVAAFVCYRLMVSAVLGALQGASSPNLLKLPLPVAFDHKHRDGRTEYLRARLKESSDGSVAIVIHGRSGAGVLSSLTGADGLVEIPADHGHVKKGDILNFLPLRERGL